MKIYHLYMRDTPYLVCVVLDREYGTRLSGLLEVGPVWAIDSQTNREIAQIIWEESPTRDEMDGITIFKALSDGTPEEILINELGTIDLHHGPYSTDSPYTVIRVIGTFPTERIEEALSEYGFDSFHVADDGFHATRSLEQAEVRHFHPSR